MHHTVAVAVAAVALLCTLCNGRFAWAGGCGLQPAFASVSASRLSLASVAQARAAAPAPQAALWLSAAQLSAPSLPAGCEPTQSDAVAYVYSQVLGLADGWSPTATASHRCWDHAPSTPALTRPAAALVVASAGLSSDDLAPLTDVATAPIATTRLAAEGLATTAHLTPACTDSAMAFTTSASLVAFPSAVTTSWASDTQSWQLPRSEEQLPGRAAAAARAADPCGGAASVMLNTLGLHQGPVAADGHCTYAAAVTGGSPIELDTRRHGVRRALSEVALLLAVAAPDTPRSGACPTVFHIDTRGVLEVAEEYGAAAPQRTVVAAALVAAIAQAHAAVARFSPDRHATAIFTAATAFRVPRALEASPSPSPLPTAEDIGYYQLVLWSSVGLAFTLVLALRMMFNMDLGRDPQLYNQFKNEAEFKRD